MTLLFRWAAAVIGSVVSEVTSLTTHLLLYPTGIGQEHWPTLQDDSCTTTAFADPPVGEPAVSRSPDTEPPADEPPVTGRTAVGPPEDPGPATATVIPHRPLVLMDAPILLMHGFIDNRSVFTVLRNSLRRQGWQHVHSLNYSPLTQDVPSAAALLGEQIERIRRMHSDQRIAVVGHSLGGLIARYYVQCLGGDEHVHTLMTLGSPHGGTHAARLPSPLPITRQLRPGSAVLAELRRPAPDCRTRFVAFWGGLDEVVLPARNSRLEHPDLDSQNILVPGTGHLALPMHSDVVAGIGRVLEEQCREQHCGRQRAPDEQLGAGTGTVEHRLPRSA